MGIRQITDTFTRRYTDSGQVTTYIAWIDDRGAPGRTEGDRKNAHMKALLDRAKREGIKHRREVW